MTEPAADRGYDAVLVAVEDVLVPFRTLGAWQWAWRPQGPRLSDRHVRSAVRKALRAWDQRRWQGLTGKRPPADPAALEGHLRETLRAIAGRTLPTEETEAVVRRLLRPAGEVERFADAGPFVERLGRAGVAVGALSGLPSESARWLLQRVGLPLALLLAPADPPGPPLASRAAFEAAVQRLGVSPERTVWVGGMYWSDVRAGERAGLRSRLVDRFGAWPSVAGPPMADLGEFEGRATAGTAVGPVPADARAGRVP